MPKPKMDAKTTRELFLLREIKAVSEQVLFRQSGARAVLKTLLEQYEQEHPDTTKRR